MTSLIVVAQRFDPGTAPEGNFQISPVKHGSVTGRERIMSARPAQMAPTSRWGLPWLFVVPRRMDAAPLSAVLWATLPGLSSLRVN